MVGPLSREDDVAGSESADHGKRTEVGPSLPDRFVRNPRTVYTFVAGLILLVTSAVAVAGLILVTLTTDVLWIQLLLVLLILLLIMAVSQNLRLVIVSFAGVLMRLGLLPTDYLLAGGLQMPDTPLPVDEMENPFPTSDLAPTNAPELPSLSVLIPVVNEDADPIKMGIYSVKAAEYNGRIRIFILDDSPDGRYRQLAQETGIEYVARPEKIHGKAGNLNYTLKNFVDTDLFFVMDCDYRIVDPRIFVKMVSLMDEKTALVQAPQRYRNVFDSRASEFAEIENVIWFDTINASADKYGIVPYHGTNSIVRMSALREVGYLEEEAAVDDFPTYARMLLRGWRTAYIPDIVMEGYAPADFFGLLNQRKKWAMGMGKSFVTVGYKLIGRSGFIESLHHWCNFTWFLWPLANLCYSILLAVFAILQYLQIFEIPIVMPLVFLNLVASLALLPLLGGRKYWSGYLRMLSMDYLLTYEFGFNFIRGMLGARTDVLTPKKKLGLGKLRLARLVVPIVGTSVFFAGLFFFIVILMLESPAMPFYAVFCGYNAIMYTYSLNNLREKYGPMGSTVESLKEYRTIEDVAGKRVVASDAGEVGLIKDLAYALDGKGALVIDLPPKNGIRRQGFLPLDATTMFGIVVFFRSIEDLEIEALPEPSGTQNAD